MLGHSVLGQVSFVGLTVGSGQIDMLGHVICVGLYYPPQSKKVFTLNFNQ